MGKTKLFAIFAIASVLSTTAIAIAADSASRAPRDNPDAARLLASARAHRAVWKAFGGFTAKITVRIDCESEDGVVAVDRHGKIETKLTNKKLAEWVEEALGTVVDHRLPSEPEKENPVFADSNTSHPLGRLIELGDGAMGSSYRIRDDVITEVNRQEGSERFTISVLDADRNAEGNYLPRSFVVTVWDNASGAIKSTTAHLNLWKRVGEFDLPSRIMEVEGLSGKQEVREMELDAFKLSERSK
jgi:Protein of unknown function (DUF3386)